MKIFHLLPWYSPFSKGGTEQFMINLAKDQKKLGHEVTILCPNNKEEDSFTTIEDIPLFLFSFPHGDVNPEFIYGFSSKYNFSGFRLFLIKQIPDIIHFHGAYTHFTYHLNIIKELNIPIVITPHLVSFVCPNGTLVRKGIKQCDGKVKMIKCTTCFFSGGNRPKGKIPSIFSRVAVLLYYLLPDFLRIKVKSLNTPLIIHSKIKFLKYLSHYPKLKIDALNPWFVNVLALNYFSEKQLSIYPSEYFNPANYIKVRNTTLKEVYHFLFVGRISYGKGVHILMTAISSLAPYKDKISITLIGKLIDEELKEKIIKLQEDGFSIHHKGEVSNQEVHDLMSASDYLIFPSTENEMLPLTIQEAFSNSLPVIASDLRACKNLVEEGLNGFIYKKDSPYELSTLIIDIISGKKSSSFQMSKKAKEFEKSDYYIELYKSLQTICKLS